MSGLYIETKIKRDINITFNVIRSLGNINIPLPKESVFSLPNAHLSLFNTFKFIQHTKQPLFTSMT